LVFTNGDNGGLEGRDVCRLTDRVDQKSRRNVTLESPKANFFLYRDGIRLERNVGNTLLKYKSKSDETAEIVGELLSALMR